MKTPLGSYRGALPVVNDEATEIRVTSTDGDGVFVLTLTTSLCALAGKKLEEKYGKPESEIDDPRAAETFAEILMALMMERVRFEPAPAASGGEEGKKNG